MNFCNVKSEYVGICTAAEPMAKQLKCDFYEPEFFRPDVVICIQTVSGV
jgi:hypothetical protein